MQRGIEALTVPALSVALDAAVMRQQLHASNIANVHTIGYVPHRLSFEAEVTRAARALGTGSAASAQQADQLSLRVRTEPAGASAEAMGGVQLDREVAALAQNSMHYQVLLRALNRHLSIMASAVTEGKR